VTSLNFVCKPRDPPPRRERGALCAKSRVEKFFRRVRARRKFARIAEVPMKYGFVLRLLARHFAARAHAARRSRALSRAR
jgi:hypothetical protein